jgi:hypothetical protein
MAQNLQQQVKLYKALAVTASLLFIATLAASVSLFNANRALSPSKVAARAGSVQIDSTLGRVLTREEAIQKADSFKTWNRRPFGLGKRISPYGFAFGKERLRNLLAAIDQENRMLEAQGQTDKLIYGVRANLTFSRNDSREKRHLDLMFVPVMKNGKEYDGALKMKMIMDGGNGMILNTSGPCPPVCDEQ